MKTVAVVCVLLVAIALADATSLRKKRSFPGVDKAREALANAKSVIEANAVESRKKREVSESQMKEIAEKMQRTMKNLVPGGLKDRKKREAPTLAQKMEVANKMKEAVDKFTYRHKRAAPQPIMKKPVEKRSVHDKMAEAVQQIKKAVETVKAQQKK